MKDSLNWGGKYTFIIYFLFYDSHDRNYIYKNCLEIETALNENIAYDISFTVYDWCIPLILYH